MDGAFYNIYRTEELSEDWFGKGYGHTYLAETLDIGDGEPLAGLFVRACFEARIRSFYEYRYATPKGYWVVCRGDSAIICAVYSSGSLLFPLEGHHGTPAFDLLLTDEILAHKQLAGPG